MSRTCIAAVVLGCVLLAACSGANTQTLSSDYVHRANAVCDGWTKALNQLGQSPPLADTNRMASFTRTQVSIDTDYTAQFKALPATPSEQSHLGAVYASFDTINVAEAKVLSAAEAGDRVAIQTFHQQAVDETTKVNATLTTLQLKTCAAP